MASFYSYVVAGGQKVWEELIEPTPSGKGQYTRTGRTFTRTFRVPQADSNDFLAECYPDTTIGVGEHPVLDGMYVNTIDIDHMPGETYSEVSSGVMEPGNYMLTVTYGPLETDGNTGGDADADSPTDVLVGSVSHTMEAMSLPGYGLQWHGLTAGEELVKDAISPYLMIPVTKFSISRPRLPFIPWGIINFCTGRVNKSVFWGYAAETVLYTGASVSYSFSSNGQRQYSLEHQFSARQIVYSEEDIDEAKAGASIAVDGLCLTSDALWKNNTAGALTVPSPPNVNNMIGAGFTNATSTGAVTVYGWNHQWNASKKGFYKIKYAKTAPSDPDRFMYQAIDAFPALLS